MKVYTIRDIARRAGVGISTVSRALNNRPDVGEETRQKVMRIVEELGYAPNAKTSSSGRAGCRRSSCAEGATAF